MAANVLIVHGFLRSLISFRSLLLLVEAYPSRSPGAAKNLDTPRNTTRLSNSFTNGIAVTFSISCVNST